MTDNASLRRTAIASATVLPLVSLAPRLAAQCEFRKLIASDATPGDRFGDAVALEGPVAVVGAPGRRAAYVFRYSGGDWVEEAVLVPDPFDGTYEFGSAVSVSGDLVAVGAPNAIGHQTGKVFVYQRSGGVWGQIALLRGDGEPSDRFGSAVSLDGGRLVVGARSASDSGAGSAYVFRHDPTVPEQFLRVARLVPADGAPGDGFGTSVSLDGDRLVVGAPFHDTAGMFRAGSVYVFERSAGAWVETARLAPVDQRPEDLFGDAVGLEGERVLVGAPGHGCFFNCQPVHLEETAGAAFVFEGAGAVWNQVQELEGSGAFRCRGAGEAVALEDDAALVGAPGDWSCVLVSDAFLFRRDEFGNWPARENVRYSGEGLGERFGGAVALSRGRWVIGAPWDDEAGQQAGAVYAACFPAPARTYCEPSGPHASTLFATGSAVVTEDRLTLSAVTAGDRTLLLMGDGSAPRLVPGVLGHLCIGGGPSGVLRLVTLPSWPKSELVLGTSDVPGLPGGFLPGTTWNFQAYSYNVGSGLPTRGFSNALSITFR